MIGDRERLAAATVRVNALNAELARANDRADRAAMAAESWREERDCHFRELTRAVVERDALKAQLDALTSDEAVEAARVVLVRARPALGAPLREALAAARKAVQG